VTYRAWGKKKSVGITRKWHRINKKCREKELGVKMLVIRLGKTYAAKLA